MTRLLLAPVEVSTGDPADRWQLGPRVSLLRPRAARVGRGHPARSIGRSSPARRRQCRVPRPPRHDAASHARSIGPAAGLPVRPHHGRHAGSGGTARSKAHLRDGLAYTNGSRGPCPRSSCRSRSGSSTPRSNLTDPVTRDGVRDLLVSLAAWARRLTTEGIRTVPERSPTGSQWGGSGAPDIAGEALPLQFHIAAPHRGAGSFRRRRALAAGEASDPFAGRWDVLADQRHGRWRSGGGAPAHELPTHPDHDAGTDHDSCKLISATGVCFYGPTADRSASN